MQINTLVILLIFFPEHLSSPPVFSGVRVVLSFTFLCNVLYIVVCHFVRLNMLNVFRISLKDKKYLKLFLFIFFFSQAEHAFSFPKNINFASCAPS